MDAVLIPAYEPDEALVCLVQQLAEAGFTTVVVMTAAALPISRFLKQRPNMPG